MMVENRENLLKKLIVGMAGRAAEEMVFGETFASIGAQKDIETATDIAWKYVGHYGFGGFYGHVTSRSNDNDCEIFDREKVSQTVEALLKEAKEQAKSLLHTNLKFYQTSLGVLMEKGKISPKEFEAIAVGFGISVKEIKSGERLLLDYKNITKKFLNTKKFLKPSKHNA
jgi:cell division protease FtsH